MALGDVIRWESHRGRQLEFDEIEAGTATIWLNNRHGRYDPTFGGSPYSGQLLPLKQSRITMAKPNAPSAFVPQFTGYVEEWDFERRGPRHGVAVARLVDGFELLSKAEIAPSTRGGSYFATQDARDRQVAALADAGWPAVRTRINTGNVNLQPVLYPAGTSALEVCRDAAEAEFPAIGLIFIDKTGSYRFNGRCARFQPNDPQYDIDTWRLGDASALAVDPSLVPIFDVKWTYEKDHLYNKVLVLPAGVEVDDGYVQSDPASIAKYGPRMLQFTDLIIQSGFATGNDAVTECRDVFARYYRDNYRRPYVRPYDLEVRASFADASALHLDPLWNFILNVEIGDIVELNTVHPGGGGFTSERQHFVEGIHNYVEPPYMWRQVLDLSPRGRFDQQPYLGCD